jgi:hypothetical protein
MNINIEKMSVKKTITMMMIMMKWRRGNGQTLTISSWLKTSRPRDGLEDVEKWKVLILPGLELRTPVVQPVGSRYTDCTTATL